MNAIDFLLKEHNHVRKTLSMVDEQSHSTETKRKMFQSLGQELIRHEAMEHKIWYPCFKNDKVLFDRVKHLISEENMAEKAIQQLASIKAEQEWENKFSKLKKDVEAHASEEEKRLFPEVQKVLTEAELNEIGIKMHHFKQTHPLSIH